MREGHKIPLKTNFRETTLEDTREQYSGLIKAFFYLLPDKSIFFVYSHKYYTVVLIKLAFKSNRLCAPT